MPAALLEVTAIAMLMPGKNYAQVSHTKTHSNLYTKCYPLPPHPVHAPFYLSTQTCIHAHAHTHTHARTHTHTHCQSVTVVYMHHVTLGTCINIVLTLPL